MRLIKKNPFAGMMAAVRSNRDRQEYVDLEVFAKVLNKAPNARWRSLLVLGKTRGFENPQRSPGA